MSRRTPISGWTHVADALGDPPPNAEQTVRDVHALCREWDAGHLPLLEIRKLTTGRERNIALRHTPPAHRMFTPLMRMFDALIDTAVTSDDGYAYTTRQGIFAEQDIREAGGHVERAGTGLRIVFPIRVPGNLTQPEKDGQQVPQRQDPLFARTPEERWDIVNRKDEPSPPARRKVLE